MTSNEEGYTTEYCLTTVDNPFDPFTQFDQWYSFDRQKGYHTPGLLAAIAITSDDLSELDQFITIQDAIDDIVDLNPSGAHRKVKRGDVTELSPSDS